MRFCKNCGSKVEDNEKFCSYCGTRMDDVPQEQASQRQGAPDQYNGQRTYSAPPRATRKNSIIPVVIITAVVLVVAFYGMSVMSSLVDNNNTGSTEHSMDYSWRYYYTDSDYVDCTYNLKVPNDYYDKMEKSTIDRRGTTSDFRYETAEGTTFAVKDYIVVDQYITKVSADLYTMYKGLKSESKIDANADFASFLTAFVQGSITYQLDSDYTNGKYTDYWKYPLETLCDKTGDCEDTAILLAALLGASFVEDSTVEKYSSGVYLIPDHAMAAVEQADIPPSKTRIGTDVRFNYYLIETAIDPDGDDYYVFVYYKIGKMASEHTGDYFHLYTGTSSSYYGVTSS